MSTLGSEVSVVLPAAKRPRTVSSIGSAPSPSINTSTSTFQKRKRSIPQAENHPQSCDIFACDVSTDGDDGKLQRKKTKRTVEVPIIAVHAPPLAFPRSLYDGYIPPIPRTHEKQVLRAILANEDELQTGTADSDQDSFIDADLEQFVIYRGHRTRQGPVKAALKRTLHELPFANELISLHEINESGVLPLYFDAVIWYGGNKKFVQRVPFETLSIGGYGELERPVVPAEIWIQSFEGKRSDVWYRLRSPAPEYRRYHEPFLWMAELAKHVVDFLMTHEHVTLNQFREDFYTWLVNVYDFDQSIIVWLQKHPSKDFRQVVASQANFLWCQATQVDRDLVSRPLWSEICPRLLDAVPEKHEKSLSADLYASFEGRNEINSVRKTTVTPYVYECFKHLPCAKFLYPQKPSVKHTPHQDAAMSTTGDYHHPHAIKSIARDTDRSNQDDPGMKMSIGIGDVVVLPSDLQTTWKTDDSDWYGYVQSITNTAKGAQLGVLWLYRPSDTQCLKAPYPFAKELFMSDHCNCGDLPIYAQEITGKLSVAFFGTPGTPNVDYFVRQMYVEGDGAWQSLRKSHFGCSCKAKNSVHQYLIGDTLLIKMKKFLEPVVLVEHAPGGLLDKIKVRRLLRKQRDYSDVNATPNELVFTDTFQILSRASISRECQIRCYRQAENIPAPYNRQGVGDFYFIISQDLEAGVSSLEPLDLSRRVLLNEGWDPLAVQQLPPMKGLDIFCGGGNFGRGLEEGGAVRFDWAVDWYNEAIHTYKANSKDADTTQLFNGSVNDYLSQAMQGKGRNVAQYGQVEVIAAGSPCPGFSRANLNKANDRSLVNISMVASVVAYIDFYRPKYALLENVVGMTQGPDNVFALIVSALIGLNYQVRPFGLDAWNFGSPQSRTRVFISIAAPGLTPLPEPPQTHSHPERTKIAGLVKTPNGERASPRYTTATPYKYVTSSEAVKDLPRTDARTTCIQFPDHRMSRPLSTIDRIRVACVPRFPGGSTFLAACERGYMPQTQIDSFSWDNDMRTKKGSTCWQRIKREALMPTVLTAPHPESGAGGTILHWDEHRLLTIMEVRRAQGFLDEDVLIGTPAEKWKIVGNSVARPVALALGVSLRKAWLTNSTRSSEEDNGAEKSTFTNVTDRQSARGPAIIEPSPSTSPTVRFITRETTVSRVTVETTTTVLREEIGPSPEL